MQINFYLIFTLKKVYNHIRYKDKEEIMNIQINILKFFQSIRNPILNAFFLILTISTEVPVIVILTAIMYWCINKKYGQKLLFSLTANIAINTGIKEYTLVSPIIFSDSIWGTATTSARIIGRQSSFFMTSGTRITKITAALIYHQVPFMVTGYEAPENQAP